MKLAVFQGNSDVMNVPANIAAIAGAARQAATQHADVLLTPELFLCGYEPRKVAAEFTSAQEEHCKVALADIARTHKIALVASLPFTRADGSVRIGAVMWDAQGEQVMQFEKVHLFGPDEQAAFAAGDVAPTSVEVAGVRVSIIVCFDVEFPEMVRAAADAGADVVLVPTALTPGYDAVPSVLIPARALENHLVVAYANHTGVEGGLPLSGNSVIAGPRGETLARGGASPEIIYADVDVDAARSAEADVTYQASRRSQLYCEWASKR